MDCKEVQNLLPAYVDNAVPAQTVGDVEGHLAVCNDCRRFLSEFLDRPLPVRNAAAATAAQAVPSTGSPQNISFESSDTVKPLKHTSVDEPLTALEYIVLAVALAVLGFIVFIFMKK